MPPTLKSKRENEDWKKTLDDAFDKIPEKKRGVAEEILADLTFLETEQLVFKLNGNTDDKFEEFHNAQKNATLHDKHGNETWKETCAKESGKIRLPPM